MTGIKSTNVVDDNSVSNKNEENIKSIKKLLFIVPFIIVFFVIVFFIFNDDKKEQDKPVEEVKTKDDLYYYFKINDKEYKLGDLVSNYESNGFSYKDDFYSDKNLLVSNGFITSNFYYDSKPVFYGGIICKKNTDCKYSESNLIKINFHEDLENILIGDFIKYGLHYDDVVKKIGEPDGEFYMNSDEYVWSFYEKGKIDTPYYILEFDKDKKISGIKIGLWWYDGEYEYTIE